MKFKEKGTWAALLFLIGVLIIAEVAEFLVAYGIVLFGCWLMKLEFSWRMVIVLWIALTILLTHVNITVE